MRYSLFIALLIASNLAAGSESYLCAPDYSIGYSPNEESKEWEPVKFKTNNRYIVSASGIGSYAWQVKETSNPKSFPDAFCKNDFSKSGTLYCQGNSEFIMNKNNMRFTYADLSGYWSEGDTDMAEISKILKSKPKIEIGLCTKL